MYVLNWPDKRCGEVTVALEEVRLNLASSNAALFG
jgi:hypothetical protein